MSYRFTNTDKWTDLWFSNLKQLEMLLFMYLCDNCDIAGFIEVNYKRWASDLNSSIETIQGACKGLERGLIVSKNLECFFIRNFLKHQKNYPLNEKNNCHNKIVGCFQKYSQVFDIKDIDEFIQGACKGLVSPLGSGSGSIFNTKINIVYPENFSEKRILSFKNWFEYKKEIKDFYKSEKSIPELFKKWASKSDDEIEKIISQSISNGYKGLFELKEHKPEKTLGL